MQKWDVINSKNSFKTPKLTSVKQDNKELTIDLMENLYNSSKFKGMDK